MQDTDDIKNKTTGEVIGTKLRYYLYGGSRGNYGERRWRGTRGGQEAAQQGWTRQGWLIHVVLCSLHCHSLCMLQLQKGQWDPSPPVGGCQHLAAPALSPLFHA